MTTSNRVQLLLSGVMGVNVGLLPAALYEMGATPWLIALGVIIVAIGLLFTAGYSHLFSDTAAERAKLTVSALTVLVASTTGLIVGFFG